MSVGAYPSGHVVWAKFVDYPWWPAAITQWLPSDALLDPELQASGAAFRTVDFFNGDRAVVEITSLRDYTDHFPTLLRAAYTDFGGRYMRDIHAAVNAAHEHIRESETNEGEARGRQRAAIEGEAIRTALVLERMLLPDGLGARGSPSPEREASPAREMPPADGRPSTTPASGGTPRRSSRTPPPALSRPRPPSSTFPSRRPRRAAAPLPGATAEAPLPTEAEVIALDAAESAAAVARRRRRARRSDPDPEEIPVFQSTLASLVRAGRVPRELDSTIPPWVRGAPESGGEDWRKAERALRRLVVEAIRRQPAPAVVASVPTVPTARARPIAPAPLVAPVGYAGVSPRGSAGPSPSALHVTLERTSGGASKAVPRVEHEGGRVVTIEAEGHPDDHPAHAAAAVSDAGRAEASQTNMTEVSRPNASESPSVSRGPRVVRTNIPKVGPFGRAPPRRARARNSLRDLREVPQQEVTPRKAARVRRESTSRMLADKNLVERARVDKIRTLEAKQASLRTAIGMQSTERAEISARTRALQLQLEESKKGETERVAQIVRETEENTSALRIRARLEAVRVEAAACRVGAQLAEMEGNALNERRDALEEKLVKMRENAKGDRIRKRVNRYETDRWRMEEDCGELEAVVARLRRKRRRVGEGEGKGSHVSPDSVQIGDGGAGEVDASAGV